MILGLGSSTLNGTGPSLSANQLRNRLIDWAAANTSGTEIGEVATGGFYTDMSLPDNSSNATTRVHDNSTAIGSLRPDIAFVMFPSNDADDGNNEAAQYVANLRLIKNELEKYGAFTFIQDAQPRTAFNSTEKQRLIDGVTGVEAEFLEEDIISTFSFFSKESPNVGDILDVYDSGDGVHLDDVAHGELERIITTLWVNKFRVSDINGVEIERSLSSDSGFTVIETDATEFIPGSLLGELQSRIDGQEYFYRSRIRFNDSSYSPYSNTISVQMPVLIENEDQEIQINLTDTATSVAGWNIFNVSTPTIGASFTNLLDSSDVATGVDITLIDHDMTNDIGVTGGGHYPDLVIGESWEINGNETSSPQAPAFRIDGLEDNTSYNIIVITSDSNAQNPLRTSIHIDNNAVGALSGGNDGSEVIEFNNVIPTAGSLTMGMRAPWGHIGSVNGIVIKRREKGIVIPVDGLTIVEPALSVESIGIDIPVGGLTIIEPGLTVSDPFSMFINLGGVGTAPTVAGWESLNGWNNTGNLAPDTDITFNQSNGVDIVLINDGSGSGKYWGFTNTANGYAGNNGGTTGDDSGIVPDDVSLHHIFVQARSADLRIDGLPVGTYEIRVMGSRNDASSRISDFTVDGTTISVECGLGGNTSNEAVFTGVPLVSGSIIVTLGDGSGDASAFAYINALKIIKE